MDQKKAISFLGSWVGTTLAVLVGSWIFSQNIVLGNNKLSTGYAAILSGLILTVLMFLVPFTLASLGVKLGNSASKVNLGGIKLKAEFVWGLVYFGANIVFIWILKRFALQLGLGVSSVLYVVVLAVVVTLFQWAAVKLAGPVKK